MRTIKFRGKRVNDYQWVYGDLETRPTLEVAAIHQYDENGIYDCQDYVDKDTVGQYTGLVDRNGLEIYEGDFILHEDSTWGGVVQWHPNGYFFINDSYWKKYQRLDVYRSLGDMLDGRSFIVTGNIHDNPELLEKGGDNE